jgi:hypothetical protein
VLDFPASGDALWGLFDQGGPRPEYVLPTLYAESGFDPSISNTAGSPNYGINQASPELIASYGGTDVPTYLTWPASRQIATVVVGMLRDLSRTYGALRSGARVEQANFLPATLGKVGALDGVLTRFPEAAYTANHDLDSQNKGTITVRDLARFVGTAAKSSAVQSAIARTYELRPNERPRDPVLGEDFGLSLGPFAAAAAFAFLVYAWVRT